MTLVGRDVTVVFMTAHDEYALRVFEVHAVEPFNAERLTGAFARVRERIARREPLPLATLAAAARPPGVPSTRVLVRDGGRVHVIPTDTIDYVQAQNDYVAYRADGKHYLKEQTLAEVEGLLDPATHVSPLRWSDSLNVAAATSGYFKGSFFH